MNFRETKMFVALIQSGQADLNTEEGIRKIHFHTHKKDGKEEQRLRHT